MFFFVPERFRDRTNVVVSMSYQPLLTWLFQNKFIQGEKCTFFPGACTLYGMGYQGNYSHSTTCVRLVLCGPSFKLNFMCRNFPKFNSIFFISGAGKFAKLCFKMCNKKIKTSANTKENIMYVFHAGCKMCFH